MCDQMNNENTLKTAEDEVVLRSYTITEVDFRSRILGRKKKPKRKRKKFNTEGTVHLTNRRLIYVINNCHRPIVGNRSRDLFSQQLRIEDIQGIEFMSSSSMGSITGPAILTVLSFLVMLVGSLWGVFPLLIGLVWLSRRARREQYMMFKVYSPANGCPIYVSETSRDYSGSIYHLCAPTPEFEKMSLELGAIVLDLQKYGDECIPKWLTDYGADGVQ